MKKLMTTTLSALLSVTVLMTGCTQGKNTTDTDKRSTNAPAGEKGTDPTSEPKKILPSRSMTEAACRRRKGRQRTIVGQSG